MKRLVFPALLILGCTPFLFGYLLDRYLMANPDTIPPSFLIGIALLAVWLVLACLCRLFTAGNRQVVLLLNLPAFVVLVLIGFWDLTGATWMGPVTTWTQLFYLPLMRVGVKLFFGTNTMLTACCVCFVLMVGAAYLGCRLCERRLRKKKLQNPAG